MVSKVIFLVHPTKTGGMALKKSFRRCIEGRRDVEFKTKGHRIYKKRCPGHFVVLPVRNPYTRIHSQYHFYRTHRNDIPKGMSFEDFVMLYPINKVWNCPNQWLRISEMVGDVRDVDFFIRFERMEEDFQMVCSMFGLQGKLYKRNVNHKKPELDMSVFKPWMIEKVNEYFRDDFHNFGYLMESVNGLRGSLEINL